MFERSELTRLGLSLERGKWGCVTSVFFFQVSLFFHRNTKRIASRGWRAKREFLPVTPFNASNTRQERNMVRGTGVHSPR